MTLKRSQLAESLQQQFGDRVSVTIPATGQVTVEINAGNWVEIARVLRDHEDFSFEQLTDLCGIDYLGHGQAEWETTQATSSGFSRAVEGAGPGRFSWAERAESADIEQRFGVVVHLLSIRHTVRLRIRTFAADEGVPLVPSLVEVWNSANWYEREAFDLFGIVFEGHPDLRRIMTDYGFTGHPFRKDFPLIGNVTVRYDEDKGRVVYEPVEIEPRVGVPRVIRDDSRYKADEIDLAADEAAEQQAEAEG